MIQVLSICLVLLGALVPQKAKGEKAKGYAGEWMTSFGPLKLSGKGQKLNGEYGFGNGFKITGEVEKSRFVFDWSGSNGGGEGWFELWKDGETFAGQYTDRSGQGGYWGGYRKQAVQAEREAGKVTDGQSESGLIYHLRVPKGYDKKKSYTAVALLHGSNYNSRDYVEGFPVNWPELAERYILVGFNGEQLSSVSREGARAFNATYVEFSGDKVGEPWRYNQTPSLLAAALDQLRKELNIERWYVGGHSQGGFLTLAMAMFYPDRLDGAFEVAGNLLVQCEPDYFRDEKIRAAQRRLPIAVVHGERDDVVEFSAATYTYEAFQDGGFPKLRLFRAQNAGHAWAFLPVDQALLWLDQLSSTDAEDLIQFARNSIQEERWRDATAALQRAGELGKEAAVKAKVVDLQAEIDAKAAPQAKALTDLIASNKDNAWVDAFWEFREHYAFTAAAESALKGYERLRKEHQAPAERLFLQARGLEDSAQRTKLYREIVDTYYASSFYRLVKGWL